MEHRPDGLGVVTGQRLPRYVCGNVRDANGACDAPRFDAEMVEEAVLDHLTTLFVDFEGWLADVTERQAAQRDGLLRQLATVQKRRAALVHDEELVRADYRRELRAGNDGAAEIASSELDRVEVEATEVREAAEALEARIAEWDS